jgi:predicted dehydrogenase
MLRIGIAGVGFMGMIHYLAARKLSGASVAAIHSRDPKKLTGDWRSIRGNFGPPGEVMDLSNVRRHGRFEDMLADPAIDLIDVCTPTAQHEPMAVAALQAGKHVLVEKPIALEAAAADRMVRAAAEAGKLLMVAQVLPFFPEFAFALDAVRGGRYGRLLGATFKRVIARPDWSAAIGDAAQTGGPAIDLHIHDTHFVRLLCGMPERVFATGHVEQGVVDHLATQYLFGADGPSVTCTSGALSQKGRPFVHGYELYLERATLTYESGVQPLTLLLADGTVDHPKLSGGDDAIAGFTAELQAAVDGVQSGTAPDVLGGALARDALVLCVRECDSVRTGQIVSIQGAD